MNMLSVCVLVAISFLQVARSSQQVTLTCPSNDVTERGLAGPSGKKGPKGEPGMKGVQGAKGERGQCDDCRETIERLERRLVELENNFNHRLAIPERPAVNNYSNCDNLYQDGFTTDGSYNISVNRQVMEVYCEFQRDGNNWMIFQKRFSGEVDFYRNWNDYVEGFGHKRGEFWLGLKDLHSILSTGRHMLRVDIEDWEGNTAYAEYRTFSIGDKTTNYRSTIQGYSGNAGNALTSHNNQQFSTKDRDNDISRGHCSRKYFGGWWYWKCHYANLNGKYLRDGTLSNKGMTWWPWKNSDYSLKKSEMKIRPLQQ